MMYIKSSNFWILIMCVVTGTGLFIIKNKVNNLCFQLSQVINQIKEEKNKIYVLEAEIAYLTSPSMLKQYVDHNFELQTVKIAQIIRDPLREPPPMAEKVNIPLKQVSNVAQVKWRLKKNPNRYIKQTVMAKNK